MYLPLPTSLSTDAMVARVAATCSAATVMVSAVRTVTSICFFVSKFRQCFICRCFSRCSPVEDT